MANGARWNVTVLVFVAFFVGTGLLAMKLLFTAKLNRIDQLSHSTYVYTSQDAQSAQIAQLVRSISSIECLRVEDPGTGLRVRELVGSDRVATPMLIVRAKSGVEYHSGTFAVTTALGPLFETDSTYAKGQVALFWWIAIICACGLLAAEISRFAAYLPFLGFAGLLGLIGGCVQCRTGGSLFSDLAPLAGCIYLSIGILLFVFRRFRSAWFVLGFLVVSGLVPLVQAFALVSEPRLCPGCLMITFTATGFFVSTLRLLLSSGERLIETPAALRPVVACIALTLIARNLLAVTGVVSVPGAEAQSAPDLVGHKLTEYVQGRTEAGRSGIYLISLPGCHECQTAKSNLTSNGVEFTEIVASLNPGQGYFSMPQSTSFPVPLILVCNGRDQVTYQRNGWTADSNAQALRQELKEALRKSQ